MRPLKYLLNRTSFFPDKKVYAIGFALCAVFIVSYFYPTVFAVAQLLLLALVLAVVADAALLYLRRGVRAHRIVPDRFSNGDDNKVLLQVFSSYAFPATIELIDELPYQFQARKWSRWVTLKPGQKESIEYLLKPQQRGEYRFGAINALVRGPLGMAWRRYRFNQEQVVKVYPSFMQVRRFQLLAAANRLQEAGIKRQRALGHSLEFEQIKEYVRGDDYRTVNWKATARRGDLMVNNFTDERSQQVYCIINKGRTMKMPFEGMTLLDYAINAALVLSNVALMRQDKAGLITFGQKIDSFLQSDKRPGQFNQILETLYREETTFLDVDFEKLFAVVRNRITQRSLLVLFTNFESFESLERELP
ncbi:MAG: DUF58 domain-containing protein, partial [Chitinophagaceae bacterium]